MDGKARLVSAVYCDGLGDCLGHCPRGAIRIVEKEVDDFDFASTNKHLKKLGRKQLKINPLEEVARTEKQAPCACPGSMLREIRREQKDPGTVVASQETELTQWPIQLRLLPPNAPFFSGSNLLIAADCVGFAYPNLHSDLIKGSSVVIGCPKLDDVEEYAEKFRAIIEMNYLKSITVAIMEVPCCYGMYAAVEKAVKDSGKRVPLKRVVIRVNGSAQDKGYSR